jgi:putative sterol carrier protein
VDHQAGKAALAASGKGRKPGKTAGAMCEWIADEGTLRAIFAGELSPLEALMQNRLRVRGDVEYGRLILRHLAANPGMRTEICR